jgi:alkyl sulfatase BDS1-like metallo-beta-lactamase superfamily hydrolase
MSRLERRNVFSAMAPIREEECTPDVFMVAGFGNTGVAITEEGVVVVDNTPMTSSRAVKAIRERTEAPIHTIIYTHGHGDHAFATAPFIADAKERGHPKPRIIAHELVTKRFDRYLKLSSYNRYINRIQAGRGYTRPKGDEQFMPADIVYPEITYSDAMQFKLGGLTFEVYYYMGETDDGTWVWIPERKTAIVGDLMVGVCPNIGNPFKVQRYELEWAEGLEMVAGKNPDFLIPGHGRILKGKEIQEMSLDTAKLLRYIHDEVVRLLNEGCWIEEILERVKIPEDLANKPWLAPIYGCPTYIIHGVHRRYAGWYNGNPSEIFPAKSADIAAEVVKISGADNLINHAKKLQQEGEIQLALNVVDFAIKGAKDTAKRKAALLLKAELLDARAEAEVNTIASNIMLVGAEEAEQEANAL